MLFLLIFLLLRNPRCFTCPDIDCVRTDYQDTFKWHQVMTVCTRESETFSWIGYGSNVGSLHTWHHACLKVDMIEGVTQLVEDGHFVYESEDKGLIKFWQSLDERFSVASPSCMWRSTESGYMSIYGKVTRLQLNNDQVADFNIYSRGLSVDEMIVFTGCKKRILGDVINWDQQNWILDKGRQSYKEVVDFEESVCIVKNTSLLLVPLKKNLDPFKLHTCKKLMGRIATYDNKEQFHQLGRFLLNSNLRNSVCSKEISGERYQVRAFVGSTDAEVEGVWKHFHNQKQIDYLPWMPNRPYLHSREYNCLELETIAEFTNDSTGLNTIKIKFMYKH